MGKNIGKNISKNLSSIYIEELIGHAQKSAADALNTTSKRVIKETIETTDYLICNEIADKITKSASHSD